MVVLACAGIIALSTVPSPSMKWTAIEQQEGSKSFKFRSDNLLKELLAPTTDTYEVSPQVRAYIHHVLSVALRDPVALRDFALRADGSRVVPVYTSQTSSSGASVMHKSKPFSDNSPEAALNDDLRIGQCWLVENKTLQLGVALHAFIRPTHVTVDHIPLEIAADIGRAPRKILVWGLIEGPSNLAQHRSLVADGVPLYPPGLHRYGPPLADGKLFVLLASFEYDIYAPFHIQSFPLDSAIVASNLYFGVIVFEVLDNWGADQTCIYRFRVHGNEVIA